MNVCIIQPNASAVSETFLRAHEQHLPATTTVVYGLPASINGRPVLGGTMLRWTARKLGRALGLSDGALDQTPAFLTAFRRLRTHVVLAEYGPCGVAVMKACRQAAIPLVVHFHGYDASMHDVLAEHRETYPRMFAFASRVIAVSNPMRARLIACGAPPEKVTISHYGVDCNQFAGAAPAGAPPVFLAVGRFVEKKAPLLTLASFAEVHREFPLSQLRMIGDGPLMAPCIQFVRERGLEDAVEFLGAQPPEVVRREMAAARAFVQHSVVAPSGDSEGLPIGILEAGASGLPVISTRHAGIPEAVVHGQTGLLVDEGDTAGMAAAMRRVLAEPTLAGELGRSARQRVCTHFNLEASIRRLDSILHESCAVQSEKAGGRPLSPVGLKVSAGEV